ncbi:MAG: thiol-disulfide isomerase [Pedosphaera sp.]|nr:thiol-disulfide isomerase [Pedosphaera sp.]
MKHFRPCSLSAFLFLLICVPAWPTTEGSSQYAKALAQAGRERKFILLDFTGSDWCSACIRSRKQVLDQKEFLTFAATNLVLVEVDFPENKTQEPTLKRQNAELEKQFKVDGYPTFILVDATGRELGRQTGLLTKPSAFIATLRQWQKIVVDSLKAP